MAGLGVEKESKRRKSQSRDPLYDERIDSSSSFCRQKSEKVKFREGGIRSTLCTTTDTPPHPLPAKPMPKLASKFHFRAGG
jgi:hypothetical protein